MTDYKPSRIEMSRIFMQEYFLGHGVYYSILRIIGGPLLIILGVYYFLEGTDKGVIAYSGLMIGFGVYYLVKPILSLLLSKTWYAHFDSDVKFSEDHILLSQNSTTLTIELNRIEKIRKGSGYFVLTTQNKETVYLVAKQLEKQDIEKINSIRRDIYKS